MRSNVWSELLGWGGSGAGDDGESGSLTRQCKQLVADVDGRIVLVPFNAVLSPLPQKRLHRAAPLASTHAAQELLIRVDLSTVNLLPVSSAPPCLSSSAAALTLPEKKRHRIYYFSCKQGRRAGM